MIFKSKHSFKVSANTVECQVPAASHIPSTQIKPAGELMMGNRESTMQFPGMFGPGPCPLYVIFHHATTQHHVTLYRQHYWRKLLHHLMGALGPAFDAGVEHLFHWDTSCVTRRTCTATSLSITDSSRHRLGCGWRVAPMIERPEWILPPIRV